jgi:hypothetical protein
LPLELCRVATEEGRQAKGDVKAAAYIQNLQMRAKIMFERFPSIGKAA